MLSIIRSALQGGSKQAAIEACLAPLGSLRGFASDIQVKQANPQDYSLVMAKAAELSKDVAKAPDQEVGLCAGVPLEAYQRQVRIWCPAKTAGQSGLGNSNSNTSAGLTWAIGFDTTQKWQNPLMGWTSTADPLENVGRSSLWFQTKEQAMEFCKKHGWGYNVEEPNQRRRTRQARFAAYGDNFSTRRKGVPDLSTLPSNRLGLGTPAGK